MTTDNPTFFDNIKGLIGHVAWVVFLWSIGMTDEQYHHAVHISCIPDTAPAHCEHGFNGLCHTCDAMMMAPQWEADKHILHFDAEGKAVAETNIYAGNTVYSK